jgi:hypothetical protein
MEYKFTYRRRFFWKTLVVEGHRFEKETNRMELFFKDGSVLSISQWSKYDLKLGTDWVLAVKKQMEKEAGQPVPVSKIG